MSESVTFDLAGQADYPSPNIRAILAHLCEGTCHTFGSVVEWCETRGDCTYAVICPSCRAQFVVDEDELADLRRWTERSGSVLSCGVRWD
ncbi:MAG TPA: hypothetical protein VIL01_06710 [Thermomicrobiales bacterium]